LVYAVTRGWKRLLWSVGAFIVVSALYWGPALLEQGAAVRHDVLGYTGLVSSHEWGVDFLANLSQNHRFSNWIENSGPHLVVALCAIVPAILVWRRPATLPAGVALGLCGF